MSNVPYDGMSVATGKQAAPVMVENPGMLSTATQPLPGTYATPVRLSFDDAAVLKQIAESLQDVVERLDILINNIGG